MNVDLQASKRIVTIERQKKHIDRQNSNEQKRRNLRFANERVSENMANPPMSEEWTRSNTMRLIHWHVYVREMREPRSILFV